MLFVAVFSIVASLQVGLPHGSAAEKMTSFSTTALILFTIWSAPYLVLVVIVTAAIASGPLLNDTLNDVNRRRSSAVASTWSALVRTDKRAAHLLVLHRVGYCVFGVLTVVSGTLSWWNTARGFLVTSEYPSFSWVYVIAFVTCLLRSALAFAFFASSRWIRTLTFYRLLLCCGILSSFVASAIVYGVFVAFFVVSTPSLTETESVLLPIIGLSLAAAFIGVTVFTLRRPAVIEAFRTTRTAVTAIESSAGSNGRGWVLGIAAIVLAVPLFSLPIVGVPLLWWYFVAEGGRFHRSNLAIP